MAPSPCSLLDTAKLSINLFDLRWELCVHSRLPEEDHYGCPPERRIVERAGFVLRLLPWWCLLFQRPTSELNSSEIVPPQFFLSQNIYVERSAGRRSGGSSFFAFGRPQLRSLPCRPCRGLAYRSTRATGHATRRGDSSRGDARPTETPTTAALLGGATRKGVAKSSLFRGASQHSGVYLAHQRASSSSFWFWLGVRTLLLLPL